MISLCRHRANSGKRLWPLACSLLLTLTAAAQDLSVGGGASDTDDHSGASYAWLLQLHELLRPGLGGSYTWINEGHLLDHHRDGLAAQLWWERDWNEHLRLRAGAGPYLYFDTMATDSSRGFEDVHGLGAALSAEGVYQFSGPWSAWLAINLLHTPNSASTRLLLLGAGYRLNDAATAQGAAPRPPAQRAQEVETYVGRIIVNRLSSPLYTTYSAGYRLEVSPHLAWSLDGYHDQNPVGHPYRLGTQMWLVDRIAYQRLSLSAGLGLYSNIGGPTHGTANAPSGLRALLSVRVAWRATPRNSVGLQWSRVGSEDDRDRDILLLGVAHRLP